MPAQEELKSSISFTSFIVLTQILGKRNRNTKSKYIHQEHLESKFQKALWFKKKKCIMMASGMDQMIELL